jgi:hypothetical protein
VPCMCTFCRFSMESHLEFQCGLFRPSPTECYSLCCREDLNILVKRHIQLVVPSSPAKAVATLENDASELIANGMVTLNAKLNGVDDDKLISRVVEIWGFFWDQVLTYLEGVSLIPLSSIRPLTQVPRSCCRYKRTPCYCPCTRYGKGHHRPPVRQHQRPRYHQRRQATL